MDRLSATLDRPLFSPNRRPPAPAPRPVQAIAPPPPPQPPPNLILFGVVMDGEGTRALVRAGADKKMLRAKIGDDIDGWKVSQIEARKVVLSLDERLAAFALFSNDGLKADSAGTPQSGDDPKSPQRQSDIGQITERSTAPPSGQPRKRRKPRE
jgi:general secretion pathway protein N